MRLFVALDLDDSVRKRLKCFGDRFREFAPEARWIAEKSFHITLKFIGQRSQEQSAEIKAALAGITSPAIPLEIRGYGFFPTTAAPRVFWAGVRADESLTDLAREVDINLAGLGVPLERGPYHPHITLARIGSGAQRGCAKDRPNARFRGLQEKLATTPEPIFGSISATGFFLYESRVSSNGSIYNKVDHFPLC